MEQGNLPGGERGVNRLAWALIGGVFLAICTGGLVTAYGAGMAIPDWPTAFGRWFSPPQRWLGQPNDLLVSRGHRALSQLAVVGAIALAAALWRSDARRRVRRLGLAMAAIAMVAGTLGGWRVLGDSVPAGRLHAALAPWLLALCVAVAAVTSQRWLSEEPAREHRHTKSLRRWCLGTLVIACLLALAGVQLRLLPPNAGLMWLPFWAWVQVSLAVLCVLAAATLLLVARRHFTDCPMLVRRFGWFGGLLAAQLLTAGCHWVTSYGWPPWFTDSIFPIPYTVVADGPLQLAATTAHVALESVVPAVGANMTLWAYRVIREPRA